MNEIAKPKALMNWIHCIIGRKNVFERMYEQEPE